MPERHRKVWTAKEESYLQYNWGELSIKKMAEALGRTEWAVATHAVTMRLGPYSRGTMSLREVAEFTGFSVTKVRHAIKKLGLRPRYAWSSEPGQRKLAEYAIDDEVAEQLSDFMEKTPLIRLDNVGAARTTAGMWGVGKKPAACVRCGTSDRPHYAKGHCRSCYWTIKGYRDEYRTTGNPIGRNYKLAPVLTTEKVVEMRIARKKGASYDALARRYGVSRPTVTAVCRGTIWKEAGGPTTIR
jgi:hypothetical protein